MCWYCNLLGTCCSWQVCYNYLVGRSLVCYTNRTDKLEAWKEAETSQLQLKVVDISEPLPYLPGNIEFADKVLVTIRLLFRVAK
mmetsp:Transcript_8/g.22  ORF Transcript_8/g.22 Transcript_8/m.22 type:complete len:84 (-) Transcript_8:60-311(-)